MSKFALAKLRFEENIQININDSRFIYPSRFYFPLIICNVIEILLYKRTICNHSVSFELPEFWHILLQKLKNKIQNAIHNNEIQWRQYMVLSVYYICLYLNKREMAHIRKYMYISAASCEFFLFVFRMMLPLFTNNSSLKKRNLLLFRKVVVFWTNKTSGTH